MSFAQNIQYLRKLRRITQEELSDLVGVSRQSVSKWETGDAFPETEKIMQLCDIFNVSMDVLMRGDAQKYFTENENGCDIGKWQNAPPEDKDGEPHSDCAETRESNNPLEMTREEVERVKSFSTLPERTKRHIKRQLISSAATGIIFAVAAIVYICLGAILNLWHPAWVVFIFALAVAIFTDGIIRKRDCAAVGIMRGLRDSVIVFAAAIYLLTGFLCDLWHPAWVIFIAAVILSIIFDIIKEAIKNSRKK